VFSVSWAFIVSIFINYTLVYYIYLTSLTGFDSAYIPTYRWYMTISGEILLVIIKIIKLLSTEPTNEATTKQTIKS